MKFIDEAKIEVIAGNGGNGSASMRREKFIEYGGPDGGDGGKGGNVYFVINNNMNTLTKYHFTRRFQAGNGLNGKGSDCYGRNGKDIILEVPKGTIVRDINTSEIITDLTEDNIYFLIAKGGSGGFGNLHFKSSINRAPRQKTNGTKGESKIIKLELQLLADVGLLGYPNSGKSTFISFVSNAKSKIAEYPFTTLTPKLGVVNIDSEKKFIIADIPGIINGASKGAGLGHQFLKHLQRTKLLLHFIDFAPTDKNINPYIEGKAIINELLEYDKALYNKPRWIILNKMDIISNSTYNTSIDDFSKIFKWKGPIFPISSLTGYGCKNLCIEIYKYIYKRKKLYK